MPAPTSRPRKRDQPRAQSFDFGTDVRQILRSLAEGMGISQVAVLELAIRRLARRAARMTRHPALAERDTAARTGVPHSFRLSVVGRRLLDELAAHEPPLADSLVAAVELAIRQFAEFAVREDLVAASPE